MKKFFLILLFLFFTCSEPSGPDNGAHNHAILFNSYSMLGEEYAVGLINSDGTNFTKIGEGLLNAYPILSVSKDGSIIVYVTRDDSYLDSPFITVSNLKDLTDHIFMEIKGAANPIVSPNGKYIAYLRFPSSFTPDDSVGLYTMEVNGSNKKFIHPDSMYFHFAWKSDNSGLIYSYYYDYDNETGIAYFIDRDGTSSPVEVESPFNLFGPEDMEYYDLDLFERAEISLEHELDSVGFYPYQFNEPHNKAWNLNVAIEFINRIPTVSYFLLGYDFEKMTERELNIGAPVYSTTSISWSPNNKDIAVFTSDGLDIVRIDGYGNRILNYEINSPFERLGVYHKWIPVAK